MLAAIARILPRGVKRVLQAEMRNFKAPKMIWGYRDASGVLRERTRISDTALLYRPERIFISDNVFVGHYNILDGVGGLEIGEGVQLAAGVGIFTHSSHVAIRLYGDHYHEVPEHDKKGYRIAPVRIGKYVFVGAGAKIFSGVTIGDGAMVYAGSVVTRDVAEFQIVSGNPAKVVGNTRELDDPYLKDPQLFEWYSAWQNK